MEKHRCKLCNKYFSNGRALGGHMRSHLSTLPLPPKKVLKNEENFHFFDRTESDSSSSQTRSDNHDGGIKPGFLYELRENPKKSSKAALIANRPVVQDGESDTESTQYPTRRRKRSKRVRSKWVGSESPTESTQVSSVSDSASRDEEVALCLMMLSRDAWVVAEKPTAELTSKQTVSATSARPSSKTAARVAKFKCLGCKKVFRTSRALEGHQVSNKQCWVQKSHHHHYNNNNNHKIFECPFCYKVFGSGQALGGHKRSHLISLGSTTTTTTAATTNDNNIDVITNNNVDDSNITTTNNSCSNVDDKVGDDGSTVCFILDLNLPPPIEVDDDFVA